MIVRITLSLVLFLIWNGFTTIGDGASKPGILSANKQTGRKMVIRIGKETFGATLYDNPTAKAFAQQLPLTLMMKELNGNEKYAQLKSALPVNEGMPDRIHVGDVLLYGSNTLVLFYQAFQTSYSYTPVGKIDQPENLAQALGNGNVTVQFEMK